MNIAAFIAACRKLYIPEEEAFRQLVETVDYSGLQGYTDLEGYLCMMQSLLHVCAHTHTHTTHAHTAVFSRWLQGTKRPLACDHVPATSA